MTPSWPTAQPFLSLTKYTAVRSELTGTGDCVQVAPPSFETTMCPRWPTATRRSPARAAPCIRVLLASGDIDVGVASTSTKPAAWAGSATTQAMKSRQRSNMISNSGKFLCGSEEIALPPRLELLH